MNNIWNEQDFAGLETPLAKCVYASQLLGRYQELVLHGGGNSSVKTQLKDIYGDMQDVIYVKSSGYDMDQITEQGFTLLNLASLRRILTLDNLSDSDMVNLQRLAMLSPGSAAPSLEAMVHALVPKNYVLHSHADPIVTISNTPSGQDCLKELFGDSVVIMPYVMPGFALAKAITQQKIDYDNVQAIVLLNHGIFTFADKAKEAFDNMIFLANMAQEYLKQKATLPVQSQEIAKEDLVALSLLRQKVSQVIGKAVLALSNTQPEILAFSQLDGLDELVTSACLTPDHVIRAKPGPVCLNSQGLASSVDRYRDQYMAYFERHKTDQHLVLDSAPRWAIWPGYGIVTFGTDHKQAMVVMDIAKHTSRAISWARSLEHWQPLDEEHLFGMEYWELQQAKLHLLSPVKEFQGKVAIVTGAASGIGLACAQELYERGAAVVGLDLNPEISNILNKPGLLGIACDVTSEEGLKSAVEQTVRLFGGLDILVPNAGIFPPSMYIEKMSQKTWEKTIDINLSSQQRLLHYAIPYMKYGLKPAIVFVGSRNVKAPGPGVSAYSVSKAGVTQFVRVAAMELAEYKIRVNIVHPDAVFDTALWTKENLEARAKYYGLTVEEYKTQNLLKTEIRSRDVGRMVAAMAGETFSRTTGAQIPVDGGHERVI